MGLKRRRQEEECRSAGGSSADPAVAPDCRHPTTTTTTTAAAASSSKTIESLSTMVAILAISQLLWTPAGAFTPTISISSSVSSSSWRASPYSSALHSSVVFDGSIEQQPQQQQFMPPTTTDAPDSFLAPIATSESRSISSTAPLETTAATSAISHPPSTPAATAAVVQPQPQPQPQQQPQQPLWKRRLVTREDKMHTHKITGGLFLLSSWGLSGYALHDLIANGWTVPVTNHGTPFVSLLLLLMGSSIAQSFSSIHLACSHRQGQPAVRNTFLCNAAVAILGSVSALWSSAWYPEALNGSVSMTFYLIMDAIGLIGMGDNLIHLQSLIASRQTKQKKHHYYLTTTAAATTVRNEDGSNNNSNMMTSAEYWKDVFVYMMPILIGAPFFVGIGWQFGIQHDRTFYLDLLQLPDHPHLEAGAVYSMVMVAMGASYSSFIVTLRDKKLISKGTEGLGLTIIMLCLVGSLYQAMRDPGTVAMILGM